MRREEIAAFGQLAGDAAGGLASQIEQMHQGTDTSLSLGLAHLEAACRILVGGIASTLGVAVASGMTS